MADHSVTGAFYMNNVRLIHESKKHGKDDFSYSIYHTIIPLWMKSFPLHWHDEVEITVITEGTALFTICNRKITASAGDILIANRRYPHCVEQYRDEGASFFSILFNTNLVKNRILDPENLGIIEDIEAERLIFPEIIKKDTPLNVRLMPVLSELIENRKKSYTDFQMGVLGCLYLVFQILSRNTVRNDRTATEYRVDFSKIKPAINAVINHYEQKISISSVAGECCLSDSHFMKLFKKTTGKTFNEFLIDHRLSKASQMLKDTDDRIIDIANSSGFYNQSYFTRMFIRHYSVTPSEYRKIMR